MSFSPIRPNSSPQRGSFPNLPCVNTPNRISLDGVARKILKDPISGNMMENPYLMVPCGHYADYKTLRSWYTQNRTRICPICEEPYSETYQITGLREIITDLKSQGFDIDPADSLYTADVQNILDDIEDECMLLKDSLRIPIAQAIELFKKGQQKIAIDQICNINFDAHDSKCEYILKRLLSIQKPQKNKKKRQREQNHHSEDMPVSKIPRTNLDQKSAFSTETQSISTLASNNSLRQNMPEQRNAHYPQNSTGIPQSSHQSFMSLHKQSLEMAIEQEKIKKFQRNQ